MNTIKILHEKRQLYSLEYGKGTIVYYGGKYPNCIQGGIHHPLSFLCPSPSSNLYPVLYLVAIIIPMLMGVTLSFNNCCCFLDDVELVAFLVGFEFFFPLLVVVFIIQSSFEQLVSMWFYKWTWNLTMLTISSLVKNMRLDQQKIKRKALVMVVTQDVLTWTRCNTIC